MRKLIALLVSIVLVCACAAGLADSKISVSGTGTVLVSADTAIVSLGVSARDQDVLKAQQKANETIAAIRTALTESGIHPEDINTGYLNIYAIYDYTGAAEEITGYNANSTLAIRVTDLALVGKVIDLAFGAGANMLNGVDFSASETDGARAEALKKAVQDARAKAEIMAEATGMAIKSISVIEESGTFTNDGGITRFAKAYGAEEDALDAETVVQSAKLQVTASVVITFEAE